MKTQRHIFQKRDDDPTRCRWCNRTDPEHAPLTRVSQGCDGIALEFICCNQVARFTPHTTAGELAREQAQHACAQPTAFRVPR